MLNNFHMHPNNIWAYTALWEHTTTTSTSNTNLNTENKLTTELTVPGRYCAKLPSDAFTHLTPQCRVCPSPSDPDQFVAYLRLPVNSPIKEEVKVGHSCLSCWQAWLSCPLDATSKLLLRKEQTMHEVISCKRQHCQMPSLIFSFFLIPCLVWSEGCKHFFLFFRK